MKLAILALSVFFCASCGDTNIYTPTTPSVVPTAPVVPKTNHIEFRVSGNATSVIVRYVNPVDGSAQSVTSLPFVVEVPTQEQTIFLSLDVTPLSFPLLTQTPFLSAQIFVNGILFREAISTTTLLNTISISGTFRAPN